MLFNSLHFALFFIIVYILYLALRPIGHKWQNRMLLAASYAFYSFWDWRFLSLIILSTLINYYFALKIESAKDSASSKKFLVIAIVLNLSILGLFKYFNFFIDNLQVLAWQFGMHTNRVTLNIILPLGISFYTFQAMSYPIDVYRKVMKSTTRLLDFALFIAFFPPFVAGPIGRAKSMLPQIFTERTVTADKFYGGCWLIFWGLFKKIVIADNIAKTTAVLFGPHYALGGSLALIAAYGFALQVYADFSGYSDMARGLARVMGFELALNFRTPFFSRDLYDLWQRWHISLTTWIKEYIFYPLALARFYGKQLAAPLVILITWAIMGFWHGAAWKFIAWGVYHGILLIIYSRVRPYINLINPSTRFLAGAWSCLRIFVVCTLFSVGLLFFAAESATQVFQIIVSMLMNLFSPAFFSIKVLIFFLALALPVMLLEYFQFKKDDELVVFRCPAVAQGVIYYAILYMIILYGDFSAQQYYYFQF